MTDIFPQLSLSEETAIDEKSPALPHERLCEESDKLTADTKKLNGVVPPGNIKKSLSKLF